MKWAAFAICSGVSLLVLLVYLGVLAGAFTAV